MYQVLKKNSFYLLGLTSLIIGFVFADMELHVQSKVS